jgi:hypothetical protein
MLFYFRSKVINTNPNCATTSAKSIDQFCFIVDIATLETLKAQSKDIKK